MTTQLHKQITCCPHCGSEDIENALSTSLGYDGYRCGDCRRTFNERTGTPFNYLEFPTDVVLQVVRWYFRYKLSLRDITEISAERGFEFTHETVRNWVSRFGPLLIAELRKRRYGKAGESWYVDETYIKVKGKEKYLYRAIDRQGNLVDVMLSDKRDMKAAKRFFRGAVKVTGRKPDRVTTDGHSSYPRAKDEILGKKVLHRVNAYLINFTEQSHRPIKSRYYATGGFGSFKFAGIVCQGFEEVRNFFRVNSRKKLSPSSLRGIRASKILAVQKLAMVL